MTGVPLLLLLLLALQPQAGGVGGAGSKKGRRHSKRRQSSKQSGQHPDTDRFSAIIDPLLAGADSAAEAAALGEAKGHEIAAALDLREVMAGIVRRNPTAHFISSDPPIIQFDEFMSPEECERFVEAGRPSLEPSTGTGSREDGAFKRTQSSERTSWNAWCVGECALDPVVASIDSRISNLTGFSYRNNEYYQILRYEERQEYQCHTDWIRDQAALKPGPRVFSFFMYLNDVPEQGGGATWFPQAGNDDEMMMAQL
jgi:hypothetical protein